MEEIKVTLKCVQVMVRVLDQMFVFAMERIMDLHAVSMTAIVSLHSMLLCVQDMEYAHHQITVIAVVGILDLIVISSSAMG